MPVGFSQRLLSVLQLTRMSLVFTAIADSLCSTLLWASWLAGQDGNWADYVSARQLLAVAIISIGLYGYGVSLNDIIDRRRDRQIAADRPLPSGRIGLIAAHVICVMLAMAALAAGVYLSRFPNKGLLSFALLCWTGALITFYDFVAKYLVAPGLLLLGIIRFFHATIPAPQLPLLWHPLLLLNHVAILSTVAYRLEQKRPALTPIHWWAMLGGLAVVDATCVWVVWWRRQQRLGGDFIDTLWITPGLWLAGAAVVAFAILAILIRLFSADVRSAGRKLTLAGLLWLIVYDAVFVAGYVGWAPAVLLLLLLPISYLSVVLMRWWARIVLLSQRPEYQRAR